MAPRSPPVQSRRETREQPAQKCGNSIVSLFPALGHWNLASFCSVGRYACAMTFCSLSSRSQRLSSFVWLTFNFKSLLRAPADRSTTIARLSHESAAETEDCAGQEGLGSIARRAERARWWSLLDWTMNSGCHSRAARFSHCLFFFVFSITTRMDFVCWSVCSHGGLCYLTLHFLLLTSPHNCNNTWKSGMWGVGFIGFSFCSSFHSLFFGHQGSAWLFSALVSCCNWTG